jgi:hypothetical protein
MAGLVLAIPINLALCHPDRDRRDKPGDDAMSFAPATRRDPTGIHFVGNSKISSFSQNPAKTPGWYFFTLVRKATAVAVPGLWPG